MKDFRGKSHYVKYLGIVTGKEFEEKYNIMSDSPGILPVASSFEKNTADSFHAWIFYETEPSVQQEEIKKEEKKPIKIEL